MMSKQKHFVIFIILYVVAASFSQTDIPRRIGKWRVGVGPPGNEFYEIPKPPAQTKPPSPEILSVIKSLAPDYTEVKRWRRMNEKIFWIRAEAGPEEYDFNISTEARIITMDYENDSTNVEEAAHRLVLKGTKREIPLSEVPRKSMEILARVVQDTVPSNAWIASTIAGQRYIIQIGRLAFYARPDGQIQAAGLIDRGALNEIDPSPPKQKTYQEILAELEELLVSYRERFNFENQLTKLGKRASMSDDGYRFIIMGDSRSNPDLWASIVKHIDMIDPSPEFVINTGDIVLRGYAKELLEYYLPPLMETDMPYFVAIGNHDNGDNAMAIEYRYLFGDNALNYYFDFGHVRFILLDNVTRVRPYEETLEWLDKTLADTPQGFRKIVVVHKPPGNIKKWAYHAWDINNSEIFTKLMTRHHVDHVFFGHIHAYSTATFDGIHYTISGGGGAGLHNQFGPMGNVHHYVICDVMPDGTIKQQVVRFYEEPKK